MISIQRGYEDWKELGGIVRDVKKLNTFVDLVDGNTRYDITNDLRQKGMVDLNYKSICATIKQDDGCLYLSPYGVEIWDNDNTLNMVFINDMSEYGKYRVKLLDNGETKITRISFNNEQKYYYSIGNNIYKNNELIDTIDIEDNSLMTEIDTMILELMVKNDKVV